MKYGNSILDPIVPPEAAGASIPAPTPGDAYSLIEVNPAGDGFLYIGNKVSPKIDHQPGRYYDNSRLNAVDAPGSFTLQANTLYVVPFFVDAESTQLYDRIAINQATQSVGNLGVLGIYDPISLTNELPGALRVNAGSFSLTGTGAKEIVIAQTLEPGRIYWLAINTNNNVGMNGYTRSRLLNYLGSSVANTGNRAGMLTRSFVYDGSLPDPFGTPIFDESSNLISIFLRTAP